APERISNTSSGYSYPADVWSAGMSLLAVAKGCYPLDYSAPASDEGEVPKDIEFWDLVDYICDRPSPVPGPGFSDDFTDFIACCLRKIPEDRLTATQLLDHTFLKQRHSPVNYGESQLDLLSGGKPDGGIGRERISTLVSNAHCNVKEKALREGQQAKSVSPSSCADGEVEDTVPSLSSFRTSSTAQLLSKAKSKSKAQLAELVEDAVTSISRGNSRRNISREDREDSGCFAGYDSDDFGELESNVDEIISSLQDACFGERWDSLGMSDNAEHFSSRHAIIEIRLRHLRTILEKVQQKYALVEGLNHSQKNALMLASQRLPDSTIGFQKQHSSVSCSSEEGSATVSSSFLSDRMVLLPAMEGKGLVMWEKFARQLHLPCSTVMRFARDVVDVRYFKES
ncbi:MKK1a, partial [Symbiodinium microadriaticum]